MAINIQLTDEQLAIAEAEAIRRQRYNEQKRYKGRNRAPEVGDKALALHRLGTIGELAVACYLELEEYLFQAETPMSGSHDLPGRIEVKTRSKHGYDLLVQLDDQPDKVFVLVTHADSVTKIVGWILGRNAMRKEWIREFVRGRPCYAVPQNQLRPIEELKSMGPEGQEGAPGNTRILEPHEAWLSLEGDEAILNFSEQAIAMLGWRPGDVLTWEVDEQSQKCYLRKTNDSDTRSTDALQTGDGGT